MQKIRDQKIFEEKVKISEKLLDSKKGENLYFYEFQKLCRQIEEFYLENSLIVRFEKEENSMGCKIKHGQYLLSVYNGTISSFESAKGAGISFSISSNAMVSPSRKIDSRQGGYDPKTEIYLFGFDINQNPIWKNHTSTYTTSELAEYYIEKFAIESGLLPDGM